MYNAFNFTEAHNNIVRKNIFHDYGISTNGGVAILLSSGANNTAYNNLIYNVAGVGLAATGGANNSILKNNISFSNGTDTAFSGTGTVATNNLTTNPQFSNPAAGDFHLQSGSPAINQGADLSGPIGCTDGSTCVDFAGTIRPRGPAWDIGAYEQ